MWHCEATPFKKALPRGKVAIDQEIYSSFQSPPALSIPIILRIVAKIVIKDIHKIVKFI